MKKNKIKTMLLLIGLVSTNSFAQNETLFSDDLNETIHIEDPMSINDSEKLVDVDSNEFYIEPKTIVNGKKDSSGFAQKSAKGIPLSYKDGGYIELIDNEIMRLEELPENNELYQKGLVLPTLRFGDKGKNVEILKSGLISNGFLSDIIENSDDTYNNEIVNAVKDAQNYYGIKIDGISGKEVYRNLFIPKDDRVYALKEWKNKINEMIEIGRLEQKPYIVIVNIPSYTLHVIETNNKEEILQSKVVVGKSTSQTPVGRDNIIGLKYNPTWTPPISHIKKTVIPNMRIPGGMNVVDNRGNKIDLSQVTSNGLLTGKYSVQQPPGENNALGLLKFETDNPDSIYLHDTNHRAFFDRKSRDLSMGCVRVQQWHELASILANSDENYIFENINKRKTYIQKIEKIPVFYTYSLVDNVEGKVGHYNDVYNKLN